MGSFILLLCEWLGSHFYFPLKIKVADTIGGIQAIDYKQKCLTVDNIRAACALQLFLGVKEQIV